MGGSTIGPMVMGLNPSGDHDVRQSLSASSAGGSAKYVAPKTAGELQKELDDANERIAFLERKLKDANISV